MNGGIFSIEEFSTFDGPGIRMSIFLKGCPLRCTWCHNPEGQRFETEYVRKNGDCLGCGACLRAAGEDPTRLTADSERACPQHLIRRCGEDVSPQALCERILKNERILRMNDGGVTFSGGEPLAQADFVAECLHLLRPRVHCAVQTCGYVPNAKFSQILAMCDYVLFDLKLMDSAQHRAFCGVDSRVIHENYNMLVKSGVPFVTRIPLIPGVTDTEENLAAIAAFVSALGVHTVEGLPYNTMAGGKYGGLLRAYTPGFDEAQPPQARIEVFARYGVEMRVL